MRTENTRDKNRKNNKFNKILDIEKEETKKGPEMSANIAKITRILLRAENTLDKYRKYRKHNEFNKILDLEKEEIMKNPEMPTNIVKIAKVTRIFLAS